jgi:putative membrane protein
MMCGYYGAGAWPFMWPFMLLMPFAMLLGLALLVIFVWALIRWLDRRASLASTRGPVGGPAGPSAIEMLRERYARGEIDAATFDQMLSRLAHTREPTIS